MELAHILEALLVASPEPLRAADLHRLVRAAAGAARSEQEEDTESAPADDRPELAFAEVTVEDVAAALEDLARQCEADGRSFVPMERAGGWKIYTKPEFAPWVRQLFPDRRAERLSAPALETLAIVAYRQPVTKASIEAVRGVSVDGMLQKLLDRNIVRIAGRADLPGRPLLYETTELFFEHFGVRSVDELPNAAELRAVKLPEPEQDKTDDVDAGGEPASDPDTGSSPAQNAPGQEPGDAADDGAESDESSEAADGGAAKGSEQSNQTTPP